MQCATYIPGYYYRDQTVNASGSLWQQLNNGVFCRSAKDYLLFQPPSIDQYLAYNREILRETMLRHEAIFNYQVHELHRLYGKQRELMDEMQKRERSKYHPQMQTSSFASGMPFDTSMNALQIPSWLLLYPRDNKPSAQGVEDFQKSSNSVSRMCIQAGSDVNLSDNHLEDLNLSSCRHKHRKKMLDLELPAEEYMDSDEGEQLKEKSAEVSPDLHDLPIRCIDSSPESTLTLNFGASSNSNLMCGTRKFLLDLNEPIQTGGPVATNSTGLIDLNKDSKEILQQDLDLCRKRRSKSPVVKDLADGILEGKGNEGSSVISGVQTSFPGKAPVSCNDNTSLGSESTKKDQDLIDTNRQRMLSPRVIPSPQFVQSDQTNAGASTSVSSHIASLREVVIAIPALPCFNTPEFISRTSKSSSGSSCSERKSLSSKRNPSYSLNLGSTTSYMSCNSDNQTTAEHYSVSRCIKDSDHKNIVVDMDLNIMPSSYLPETDASQEKGTRSIDGEKGYEKSVGQLNELRRSIDGEKGYEKSVGQLNELRPDFEGKVAVPPTSSSQFCAVASISSNSNSSANENIQNGKMDYTPAVNMASDPSHESVKCPDDDTYLAAKSGQEISRLRTCMNMHFSTEQKPSKVPTVTTALGRDLEPRISPDNKEHSLPREEAEENQSEKLGDLIEDLDRIAAEAIISISLSEKQPCLNSRIIGPLDASVDCLNWFAGIVSSVAGNMGNEFQDLQSDALGGNLFKHSEAMTWKSTENKVEDHCYITLHHKNKIIGESLLPRQQGRGRTRKAREWKELQSKSLPCSLSLSSYDVKHLTLAARATAEAVKVRKNVGRFGRARGRRRAKKCPLNVVGRRVCSLSKQQHTCESNLSSLQWCLFGWGKKNRRQKRRRSGASVHLGCSWYGFSVNNMDRTS